jgi:hypothetical protein
VEAISTYMRDRLVRLADLLPAFERHDFVAASKASGLI